MASMPPTASWRFWTVSSKTDTLTGLHRKAAPSQPARAAPAAGPGITVDDLARIAEAIKAVSETDDDVPAIAFALSRRTMSHFEQV